MDDIQLIQAARELIQRRFVEGRHHIASALRTRSGAVFTGIHLEAYVGRIAVCGEAIALGAAATAGDTNIETIVAVNELWEIVNPCGMCRELISDYAPMAKVIISDNGQHKAILVSDLLPHKYHR